jgi:hypothetical protein
MMTVLSSVPRQTAFYELGRWGGVGEVESEAYLICPF